MNAVHRAAAILLAGAACGNDAGAGATFEGSIHGLAMQPKDAISSPATVAFSSGSAPVAAIVIGDVPQLCAKVSANLEPRSSTLLLLFLADVNPVSGAIQPAAGTGSFPVFRIGNGAAPPHFAMASFGANDATCHAIDADSADAVTGSVTLTANGAGAYSGMYDLTFDSGDHVTGSFHTGTCQALSDYLTRFTHDCG
ncbi:MAG: hypothetical protein ABR567_16545 [Myxococcales bacterium]|nr:hypothetical protein [Myxococcales bacterium]